MRYNDKKHIENYIKFGTFPKIHDDIFYIGKMLESMNVIDLGCSIGMLSVRLSEQHKKVIGIEADNNALDIAIEKDNVKYINGKITKDTLKKLEDIIIDNEVRCIYARRVFPELFDTGGIELLDELKTLLSRCGVEYIVTEGRLKTRNSKHDFSDINDEIIFFIDTYKVVKRYKSCAVMKLR